MSLRHPVLGKTSPTPSPISQAAGKPIDMELLAEQQVAFDKWWPQWRHLCTDRCAAAVAFVAGMDAECSTAPTTGSAPDAEGYAFKCDGKLWVVTDPDVAMRWQAQGFQVTEVTQGADVRPVAIYQVNKGNVSEGDLWQDTDEKSAVYLSARHYQIRIVYLKEPS